MSARKVGSLYITATEPSSGKALVSLGVIDIILRSTPKLAFFRPIIEREKVEGHDEDIDFVVNHFRLDQNYEESYGLKMDEANKMLSENREDDLIEKIISKYKKLESRCDFIVCEGSDYLSKGCAVEFNLNQEIAKNLGCPILILGSASSRSVSEAISAVSINVDSFKAYDAEIVGIILNRADPEEIFDLQAALKKTYAKDDFILAVIPEDKRLRCPRMIDVINHLQGHVLSGYENLNGLVKTSIVCAMQLQNALKWIKEDDTLLVTSGDRGDIVVGAMQAHKSRNYPRLAGIILTGGVLPEASILRLINGLPDKLPIVSVQTGTMETATKINDVHATLRSTDQEKINLSIQAFESHLPDVKAFEQKVLDRKSVL